MDAPKQQNNYHYANVYINECFTTILTLDVTCTYTTYTYVKFDTYEFWSVFLPLRSTPNACTIGVRYKPKKMGKKVSAAHWPK